MGSRKRCKWGSKAVEGVVLNLPVPEDVHLKTEAFAKMKNLRLLELNVVSLTGCYEHLSKQLRWLCWHKCPLELLPQNFHLENLLVLDMQHSNVKQIWKDNRVLNKLKVLNLSYSKNFTKSPNFLQIPNLEMIILEGCTNLVELHESIEHLKGLVMLNLNGCKNLKNLPRSISNFKSLERLNLSGCLKLDELPEKLENMISLEELPIERTVMNQGFGSLGRLVLSNCGLSENDILKDIGSLSSPQGLDLSQNSFRELPNCISCLPKLQYLYLDQCKSLESISKLPANIEALYASAYPAIKELSISQEQESQLASLHLTNCSNMVKIDGLSLDSNSFIDLFDCHKLSLAFRTSLLQCPPAQCDMSNRFICLPGSEIPDWFSHQRIGSSISFHVPSLAKGEIRVLLICIVYAKKKPLDPPMIDIRVIIHNKTRNQRHVLLSLNFPFGVSLSDHLLLSRWHVVGNKVVVLGSSGKIVQIVNGEELEVSFELGSWAEVKKCGVHIVVDDSKAIDAVSGDLVPEG